MTETVVSMARSMLRGAVTVAASAAAAEMGLLVGVRKDIWFIKDELETMQAFLEVAEKMKKDVLLKVWANQVRDLSYNIEDCLGEFMVHVGSHSLSQQLMKLKDSHRIAVRIRDLKTRVEEVSIRNTRYNLIKMEASNTIDEVDSYTEDVCNHSTSNIDEAELVGFVKPKEKLIELIDVNADDGLAKVICVVGMGGLGKTTLARKTYESKEGIAKNFSCCAWITVSQMFFKIEVLKDMIRQLLGTHSLEACLNELKGKTLQVEDLVKYLIEELNDKRYLIILDDLWTIDEWRWIKDIAIRGSNRKGSRVIVTTRDVGLAEQCTSKPLIHHLKPLQIDDATNLLLKKSRKTMEDMKNDKEMRTVVNKIVKKCGGLPLAILTIGGMLATKKVTEWESIYNQIPTELESNPSLEAMRRIVTLSYNQLPSHLKSCFLYLSIFPEDFEIKRRRLVERWTAEGFVRARGGVKVDDVGISYFNELINRSMIQPSRVNMEGIIKSCRVHDIMRDIMISISRDENFVYLARDNASNVAEENFRHIAYHGSRCQKIETDWCHVRSLTMFGERPMMSSTTLLSPNLRMLRALDLEDAQFRIKQKDINNIGLLRHLKYVNVGSATRDNIIFKLHGNIGKLQGLQSLDMRNSRITTLPTEISKLQGLRTLRCSNRNYIFYAYFDPHSVIDMINMIYMPIIFTPSVDPLERANNLSMLRVTCSSCWSLSEGVKLPRGISNLKELQILDVVDIKTSSSRAIEELGELTQLKKLSVVTTGASKKKCKLLSVAIQKLLFLCSLGVETTENFGTLEWVGSIASPPPLLRTLKLVGCLGEEMHGWFGNLNNLVKLYLREAKLEEGKTMEILGALPNLMLLHLCSQAYVGEKLVLKAGAFPNLKKLEIENSGHLKQVMFEEGTSPHMESIAISACRLKSGIIGIKHLPRLKEISLGSMCKVGKLGVLQRDVDAHPNHPVLRLMRYWSKHDMEDVVQESNATVEVEEAEEESSLLPAEPAVREISSQPQVVVTPPTKVISQDDLLYTYNSC